MGRYSFFSLKTQFENLGDALINIELIRIASRYSTVLVDLSRCEESFANSISTSCEGAEYSDSSASLFLSLLKRRLHGDECYYFLSPGGYFGTLRARELPSRVMNTLVLCGLRLAGVRIVLAGVSAERFSPAYLTLFRIRRMLIHRLLARDTLSQQYLSDRSITVDAVVPDLAFNLFDLEHKNEIPQPDRTTLVFSFRCDQTDDAREQVRRLVRRVMGSLEESARVIFYSQVVRDDQFMAELATDAEVLSSNVNSTFISEHRSVEMAQQILSQGTVVLSNRLHVLLVAGSVGCRVQPVVDEMVNAKVKGLFEDIGVSSITFTDAFDHRTGGKPILAQGDAQRHKLLKGFSDVYI